MAAARASITETRWAELSPLLDAVLDVPPAQREGWIDAHCRDAELAQALRRLATDAEREGLIDTGSDAIARRLLHDDAGGVAAGDAPATDTDAAAFPSWIGRRVGAWRIESLLGEGGMASVFLARRDDGGFEQAVALKVLRHGLLDPYEQQRFLRERKILAQLAHPRIARLIDGGVTPEGVPWFAMEYVPGTAITAFCDARRLPFEARLRLFLDVCDAVTCAHQSLVVHRDLKPSNILVTDAGELRLLDFGIASLSAAADATGSEATRTVAARRRLTPAYAAPEQWQDGPVTTSADVYALGVLLHELVTGRRPALRDDGSLRRPSAQVAGDDAAQAAHRRDVGPARLRRAVAGDLDRILEVALQPLPARRYGSVAALADDVRRHLERRPVRARADSVPYRIGRFVRRHRAGVVASVLLLLSVVAGAAASLHQARLTRAALVHAQAEAERANAVRGFLVQLFADAAPNRTKGREVTAAELLDRGVRGLDDGLAGTPGLRAELQLTLAGIYRELGRYDSADALLAQVSTVDGVDQAALAFERSRVALAAGRYDDADAAIGAALELLPASSGTQLRRAELLAFQAEVLVARDRKDEADAAIREAIDIVRTQLQVEPLVLAHHTAVLGQIAFARGEMEVADAAASEALALRVAQLGELHTDVATVQHDLGVIQLQQGRLDEAQATFEAALATRRQLLGPAHVDLASTLQNLGATLRHKGERETARGYYEEAAHMLQTLFPDGHPALAIAWNSLAVLTQELGQLDEATEWLEKAIAMSRASLGEAHPNVAVMLGNLSSMHRQRGAFDRAEDVQQEALALLKTSVGERHHMFGVGLASLGFIALERGDPALALERFGVAGEVIEQALGREHPDYSAVLTGTSEARLAGGDVPGALADARAAIAILDTALPADHPRTRRTRVTLAEVLAASGDCAAAAALARSEAAAVSPRDRARLENVQARCASSRG
jgi:serine/threonine protein kinase/tetratricopeptide (TPR) repeat protein